MSLETVDIQLPDLIQATLIKNEKELNVFLKGFFNTLIFYRNDLKIYLNKYRRKTLDGDSIIKRFITENNKKYKNTEIFAATVGGYQVDILQDEFFNRRKTEIDEEENLEEEFNFEAENNNQANELTENNRINQSSISEAYDTKNIENPRKEENTHKIDFGNENENLNFDEIIASELVNRILQSEIELRYLLIENLIFVCNYYSFKSTANHKYSDNLKLMIKISHNILEKDFINLLQNSELDEEVLLFYYYKGNYSKCLNKIVSIYDSLEKLESQKDFEKNIISENLDLQKYENMENIEILNNELNSISRNENLLVNNKQESIKVNSNTATETIINISRPRLNSYKFSKNENYQTMENLKSLKSFSKEIAFEHLGYNTNLEKNINFINKEALLDKTEENDIESNNSISNINQLTESFVKDLNPLDFNSNNITNIKNTEIEQKNTNDVNYTIKIDDTILKRNSTLNIIKTIVKENPHLKNINKIKNQWFVRYINLINLISPKIQKIELMEYMKWALSKNAYKTIDILFENKIISNTKIENDFLEILKPFGIDAVIYYLKYILGNNKIEDPTHQNEIINLYTLKLKLLYESLQKEDLLITDYNEYFKEYKKKIKSIFSIKLKIKNKKSNFFYKIFFIEFYLKIMNIAIGTKKELFYFLLENKKYDLQYAYENLSGLDQLKLENSIILIKLNRLEEAAKNILCSTETNLINYIKKILKKFPIFDLVSLLLKDIKNSYPNNVRKLYDLSKNIDISNKEIKFNFSKSNKEQLNNEKQSYDEKRIITLESIFMDILNEIFDKYQLLLVQIFFNYCN